MKIIENLLDNLSKTVDKNPVLNVFKPVFEAFDEFVLGPGRTTAGSPHILDRIDIKRYMTFVIIALIPSILAGIYFYGLRVLAVIAVSYTFGGLTEVAFAVFRRKPIHEGFLVTGMIFPLILPPTIPLWIAAIGIVFGVFFGKEVFGGTGRNIFNPALVGRVFVSMAFPSYFATKWAKPLVDAITSATPLINFKSSQVIAKYSSLLLGSTAGSIGETFRIGIILGGLFLLITKISDWRIPLSYLATVGIFSFVLNGFVPLEIAPPIFQLLSGGLLFGAFFMATDPVTAPLTFEGRWIYGLFLGILTVLIRGLSGFVEGVMFAILLMNAAAPLIDKLVINTKFRKINSAKN